MGICHCRTYFLSIGHRNCKAKKRHRRSLTSTSGLIEYEKTINKYLPKIIGVRLNTLHLVKPQKAVKKAFYLFCTPRRGRVKPEQEEFLTQAKAKTVIAEEIQLQTYHWKGSGKTILLVHGWKVTHIVGKR